jgi:hypothetical protein
MIIAQLFSFHAPTNTYLSWKNVYIRKINYAQKMEMDAGPLKSNALFDQ